MNECMMNEWTMCVDPDRQLFQAHTRLHGKTEVGVMGFTRKSIADSPHTEQLGRDQRERDHCCLTPSQPRRSYQGDRDQRSLLFNAQSTAKVISGRSRSENMCLLKQNETSTYVYNKYTVQQEIYISSYQIRPR